MSKRNGRPRIKKRKSLKFIKFKQWTCEVKFRQYGNGRVAIQLDGTGQHIGEQIATASVNLPDVQMEADEVAIKDYAENEGMLKVLVDAGIVSDPFSWERSGFVDIPVCKLFVNPEDYK